MNYNSYTETKIFKVTYNITGIVLVTFKYDIISNISPNISSSNPILDQN